MNWFKFYGQDWLTDLKVMKLSTSDRLCYITLLCLASASDEQGIVKSCDENSLIELTHLYNDPYEDNNEYTRAIGCLKRFNDNGMITIDNTGDVIINAFLKRQQSNLTGYERVKKFREKQKYIENKGSINDNVVDVINDNARLDKNRIDNNSKSSDLQGKKKL